MDWPAVNWGAPEQAWLLLLALPAALLLRRAAARRRRDLRLLAGEGAMPDTRFAPARQWLAYLVPGAAFLFIVVALCRPQWGEVTRREQVLGVDILVALDVSRSMLADDLSPSRLAVAKGAVLELLPELRGDRIGLIAFAGSAFLACPLTSDHEAFAAALAEAGPDSLPLGGTTLAGALKEARRAFGDHPDRGRFLVVISDGEDHGGEVVEAARDLGRLGVRVHGLAVGTADGGLIPLADGQFLKDRQGAIVKSRQNPGVLSAMAAAGGGRYLGLSADPRALVGLHAAEVSAGDRREISRTRRIPVERFQWPLALALLLFLLEPFVVPRDPP